MATGREEKMTRRRRKTSALRRRDVLIGAGLLAPVGTLSFPSPAIAQGSRQLKMVTDWPAGSPGLQSSAERLAQAIGTASGGRITIDVFPSGALVRPFETFDAVSAGVADMYHSADYYWEKKLRAFNFFAAVPLVSLRMSFSRGSSTVEVRSCGTHSAGSTTSSPCCVSTLASRWAAGSTASSPRSVA